MSVHYENGQPAGSKIRTDLGTILTPAWPSRIRDVRSEGGLVVVEGRSGDRRFYDSTDMLEEGGTQLTEMTTGSSMGGHSPKAHGKIRYIIRAFGTWAQGKQQIAAQRLLAEHPDLVGGSKERANALAAWLKDQWTGSTHWRGPGSNPKDKARDLRLEQQARASAYTRFSHSMPQLTHAELDALVEVFSDIRPIADVLRELGIDPEGHDPYELLFEHDAQRSAEAIEASEAKLKAGEDLSESMQVWLAAHGDVKPIVEAYLQPAVERVVRRAGPLTARNDLDQRVLEAQQIGRAVEPWDTKPPPKRVLLEDEGETSDPERPAVSIELPPPIRESTAPKVVVAGDSLPSGEVSAPRSDLLRLPFNDLSDRARGLYEASAEPTAAGRSYLRGAGRNELARIVAQLESDFAAAQQKCEAEALSEADSNDLLTDPQYRIAPDTPGLDSPTRDKHVPERLDEITIKHPPNLRRGYLTNKHRPRSCAGCLNFAEGACRAYGNYPVSAGELCDNFQSTHPIGEADGYLTRGGEDVGHYVRMGTGHRGMMLHVHPNRDGTYDEAVMRMGMSRLADPENPTQEVHAGHVRVRHRGGEFQVEPDWEGHPDAEGNPELASYATVKHGARRAVELANSRVQKPYEGGDAITRVDAGSPDSPATAQWPMMPQLGEAELSTQEIADHVLEEVFRLHHFLPHAPRIKKPRAPHAPAASRAPRAAKPSSRARPSVSDKEKRVIRATREARGAYTPPWRRRHGRPGQAQADEAHPVVREGEGETPIEQVDELTGRVEEALRLPHPHIPSFLLVGHHGPAVRRAKNQMFRRFTGHFPHSASGSGYNRHFANSVRAFQRQHGLQVDGVIGKQTLAAIRGNRNASRIAPGALTAGDKRWLRESEASETPTTEIADRVVERLLGSSV